MFPKFSPSVLRRHRWERMNKTMWKWQGWKGTGHGQGFLEGVQVESLQDRLAPRDFGWDVIPWTWERQQWNLQLFCVTQVLDICYGTLGKRMLLQMRTGIWKIMEQSQWNGSLADSTFHQHMNQSMIGKTHKGEGNNWSQKTVPCPPYMWPGMWPKMCRYKHTCAHTFE